jgi:fibronectin type 3 domain-containing protein/type II secretory pathway pseudopilin PulG
MWRRIRSDEGIIIACGRNDERGETLVEVLVTIAIVGMSVVALLGALLTSTSASATHRSQTTLNGVLQSFSDAARNAIQTAASGAQFSTTNCVGSFPYEVVGAPYPRSGPPGTQVAVLGTRFATPYSGANVTGSNGISVAITSAPLAGSASGYAGAITGFSVPSNLPAGNYSVDPFDSSHSAASLFTVTPAVGAMTSSGGEITVALSGFDASPATIQTIAVGTGGSGTIVSGASLGPTGSTTLKFTVPGSLTGVQPVVITDSNGLSSPAVDLNVAAGTAPASPIATTSSLTGAQFTASVNYSDPGALANPPVPADWSATCSGGGINPNVQRIGLNIIDNRVGAGSGATLSIIVSNFTSVVTILTADPSSNQVALSWNQVTTNGGNPVTGYDLYRSTIAGAQGTLLATAGSASTSYTDTTVSNGTTYYFELTAITSAGQSVPSNQASATPATVPTPPQNALATAGAGQIGLTWNPPASNGGSVVTGYRVYRSTNSTGPFTTQIAALGNVTSYTDTGLAAGATYYYEITAVNAMGEGADSTPPTSATTFSTPSGPVLTAAATSSQINLRWTVPANGGSPITGYNVYRSTASGTQGPLLTNVGGAVTSYSDTSATPATTYYYEVTAVNAIGEGPVSNQPSAVIVVVPSPPSSLTATGGTRQVILNWTAPTSDGGSPVTGYNIYRATAAGGPFAKIAALANALTYTDSGSLNNGTTYYYEVTAINAAGEGAPATANAATWNVPGAPTGLSAGPGNNSVTLTWTAPGSNGGSAITHYKIYRSTTQGLQGAPLTTVGNVTTYTDTTATNGNKYYYEVTAVNTVGEGPVSNQASMTTGAPGAPTGLTCTPRNGSNAGTIKLTWMAPAANNGSSITGYRVYRSTTGQPGSFNLVQSNVSSSPYTDPGPLTSGQIYYYEVTALNSSGEGPPSSPISCTSN